MLEISDQGLCRLVVERGKKDKDAAAVDAEQQALARGQKNAHSGGELVLNSVQVPGIHAGSWHSLKLVFRGSTITGIVDGIQVLTATDSLYSRGMAGLVAGGDERTLSAPFYNNLNIQADDAPRSSPSRAQQAQDPIYRSLKQSAHP